MIADFPHRKLLVVDDEPTVRETLNYCLRDEYEVTAVASGEEAIAISQQEDFPVVILDLRMEGLSGLETLKRLKQIRELQNVIILTAHESTETAINALNLGAFNYLTKPFDRKQLLDVISRGFEAYEQQSLRQQDIEQRLMNVHDTFLSLLCHEFNTPLNIILGFSELLDDGLKDREQKVWIRDIRDSATHLHDILMEIVDYIGASHLASTGIEKEFVLADLLNPVSDSLNKIGVRIEIAAAALPRQKLRGPSSSIFMIARKLARMASHQSRNVRLRAHLDPMENSDQMHLMIHVSGTGIFRNQIRRTEIEQLFKPYQFTPHTDSDRRVSLGLELATCRKISEYANGSADCFFNADDELEFSARIPVKTAI